MSAQPSSQPLYRAVIFDMDGVIVDSEYAYAQEERAFLDAHGIDVSDEEISRTVGCSQDAFRRTVVGWWERGGYGTFTPDEAIARFNEWGKDYVYDYRALMNAGVPETLAALRERGLRVALASSSLMDNILEVLEACGLTHAFEVIVSGEQFHESKPNPEIYLHACELLGLEPGECCCVEDSPYGIEAGKRAGLTVFAKREDRFHFKQDEADAIIDTVPDLLEVI